MGATMTNGQSSDPLRLPEMFGAAPLKVGIGSEGLGLGSVVFDALVAHFGSVKALAIELGEADPSQVRAELKAGDFRRFDKHAKADARVVVADALNSAYGALRNADADAEHAIAQMFLLVQRVAQYIAFRRTA